MDVSTIVEISKTYQSHVSALIGYLISTIVEISKTYQSMVFSSLLIFNLRQQKFQRPISHNFYTSSSICIYDSRNFKDLLVQAEGVVLLCSSTIVEISKTYQSGSIVNQYYINLRQQKFQRPISLFIFDKNNISFEFQQVIIASQYSYIIPHPVL